MKRCLFIALFPLLSSVAFAQEGVRNAGDFHANQTLGHQRPMPMPFLRYEDIVWSTDLWKTIDLGELFNQFFYFPDDEEHSYGKKNFALMIWEAIVAGEIPIYDDEFLSVPLDNEAFVRRYTKADTMLLEIGYDEDDNELYETVILPRYFDPSEVKQYQLFETWFVGRQDARQDSRRISLAPVKDIYRDIGRGQEVYMGRHPIFWIPMQHPAVRALMARHTAYVDHGNVVRQPSWDWIFLNQHYNAFVTRESNRHHRAISDYLTGNDALIEASLIEEKVFEIEDAMWEH
ncbi:MAG: gliding motility protein GldN [Bacteroidales bacterium]|nr:gliding motility protein GldN [Bacteroidales bacterium]